MNSWKRFVRFILRMDVLNRILIFISIVSLIVVPSWILYDVDASDSESIIYCLMILGVVIGNGLLSIYKPIRTTWFYFLSVIVLLFMTMDIFVSPANEDLTMHHNTVGIYVTMIVYNAIGLIMNAIFAFKSMRRSLKNSAFNEHTNEDNPYDFLNARTIDKDIEKQVLKIVPDDKDGEAFKKIKTIKFSRYSRSVSFFLSAAVTLACLVKSGNGVSSNIGIYALVFLLVLITMSMLLPGDFKYIYYYDSILFGVLLICCSKEEALPIFWLIINMIVLVLALLVTLITEGRTWRGASQDPS